MITTFIVPGLGSSGPEHWQTWLEARLDNAVRIQQSDWKDANLADWSARVRWHFSRTPGRFIIVAHSFGVLAAVQAASDYRERIIGALLVAPADPAHFGVEELLPQAPLGFSAILVASDNDPWLRSERAVHFAKLWQAEFVNLGAAGHINVESGYGPWPQGRLFVDQLKTQDEFRSAIGKQSHRQVRRLQPGALGRGMAVGGNRKRVVVAGRNRDGTEVGLSPLAPELMHSGHAKIAEATGRQLG